jgi:hypothetical protein
VPAPYVPPVVATPYRLPSESTSRRALEPPPPSSPPLKSWMIACVHGPEGVGFSWKIVPALKAPP